MRHVWTAVRMAIVAAAFAGCAQGGSVNVAQIIKPNRELVNLSRVRGTQMFVSSATADYPPIALVDGVKQAEEWKPGVGWQVSFDDAFLRNRYFDPATDAAGSNEAFEWEGLRRNFRQGKEYAAFGWVIFQFERPRVIEGTAIHSYRGSARDLLIQTWDEPTQRWMSVIVRNAPKLQDHTVRGNMLADRTVEFEPVRTDLVRVAVRWTGDAQTQRSFTVMGRREEYVTATVQLIEVEVFGRREDGDVLTELAQQRLPDATAQNTPVEAQDDQLAVIQTATTYVNAFSEHDIDRLMETISPEYDANGEDALQLRDRLEQTFIEFPHFQFALNLPRVDGIDEETAVVSGEFWLQLNPMISRSTQGVMTFALTKSGGLWKIRSVHTAPR